MKNYKRIIAGIVCAALIASFSGCTKTVTTSEIVEVGDDGSTIVIPGEVQQTEGNGDGGDVPSVKPNSTHDDSKGDLVVEGAGQDENADYAVDGTVTIAVDTARTTDYEALFDSLKQVYKNIDIKFDYWAHAEADNAQEYLTARAAADKLPDIVWDDAGSLPIYLQNGWVYPLDSFVKNDPDFKYVPENLIRDYTFGGKLYALPHQAHFELTFVNLDVLEALNLSFPSLSWTPEDFEEYCRKATTTTYSAIEMLTMIPTMYTSAFNPKTTKYGYNFDTRQFDVSGFVEAVKYSVNLRAVPGLEAWSLRRTTTNGKTDYQIKFGTLDSMAAFNKGLTLFHGVGTWELIDAESRWSNMNWSYVTIPQAADNAGCMPVHVDHCFMTSSCKNPEAAFQVLRYITYSTEGNIARLSMYDEANKGKYAVNRVYYPTTTNPEILAKFNSLPDVTETDKYLVANVHNSLRFDLVKIIPGWSEIEGTYLYSATEEAMQGALNNVEATLTEMQGQANKALSDQWSTFNARLATIQKEFEASHPGT